ncbi:MAG: DUF2334 domain-containing protein [Telluria sp.]
MKRIPLTALMAASACFPFAFSHAQTAPAPVKTLVLYDAPSADQYSKLGQAYAIMLRNLLGHFDSTVDMMPVQNYVAGKVNDYQATFYLGSSYEHQVPSAFLADAVSTSKTVVWFKYNLWQLAWNPAYGFSTKFGFNFSQLRGMNATPTSANPAPGFFDSVVYKGMAMPKYYAFNASTGAIAADPDIGVVQVTDPTRAAALVSVNNTKTSEQAPYLTRSANFWYFADVPFSFIGPRDRYLVFADVLHDILGINHPESHKAMVRLEDVGALVSPTAMRTLTDYLWNKKIPFSVAAIPEYRDPLGVYNGGIAETVSLANAGNLKSALNYALARGGKIVMHGYTHQYGSLRNRYSAVSGDDFEFWNAAANTPVAEDSTAWATGRLRAGLDELRNNGYTPFAWEAPHYQSSPSSALAVPPIFSTTYQRVVYYTSLQPNFDAATNKDFAVGQFYPYVIKRDHYGQRVLPENLGNIEYDISAIDPSSNIVYTWQDLYLNARYARVVRDGYASFFFHPFWLEPELKVPGMRDFRSLVDGISGLGYTWVGASTVQ